MAEGTNRIFADLLLLIYICVKDICPEYKSMIKTNHALLVYVNGLFTSSPYRDKLKKENFSKGQLLIRQDKPAGDLFFLISSVVKCFITEENGRDYLLEFLGEGEII
jgi:hypothetical protein